MKTRILISSAAAFSVAALFGAYALWGPKRPWSSPPAVNAADAKSDEPRTEVVLSPEKLKTARIRSVSVAKRQVQEERTVPGEIKYRSVRRVELKAPVDSVVEKVRVKPGDVVEHGTRLAELSSPDVGVARAEVEKSESELRLANQALDWAEEITRNLNDLLTFLGDKPRPKEVEKEFDNKLLGDHREAVLSMYSKSTFAEEVWERAESAFKKGAMTEQTLKLRESNREVARAQFLSVCEQTRFDARQAREKARQARSYALRLVDVSRQKLRMLLGAFADVGETDDAIDEGAERTHFYLIAPFAGTVEQRLAADSQRVAAGSLLFAVANTDVLEVSADIREGDWQAVSPFFNSSNKGKKILKVAVPFVGEDREFEAEVDYVGRMVDPESHAVPLVALLDNTKHEFYPGMFARIRIPAGKPDMALIVPEAALGTHDNQKFVFVEDQNEPRKYRRVDVTVGKKTPAGVPITSGLEGGERVVVEGKFLLKSELLLEPEEE